MNGINAFSSGAWMSPAWQQAFAFMHMSMEYRANMANAVNGVEAAGETEAENGVNGAVSAVGNVQAAPFEDPQFRTAWNGTDPRDELVNAQIQNNASQGNGTFFGNSMLGDSVPGAAAVQGSAEGNKGDKGNMGEDEGDSTEGFGISSGAVNETGKTECKTCAERRYQDGSDDSGVSYQTPTKISPDKAPSAVRSHEQEHVVRERAAANREGRKVVSQSVSIHTAICPECGRVYVSGGVTRTVTADKPDDDSKENTDLRPEEGFAGDNEN